MNHLLTIADLSEQTNLEESRIRFYESEYIAEFPKKILHGDIYFFHKKAVNLLKEIHNRHCKNDLKKSQKKIKEKFARVIAVTSGKGGVGKTNLALNLAIEFQRLGKMTIVMDADLGMANIHLLSGIQPLYSIKDIVDTGHSISDVIMEGPEGIGIIPGCSGVVALADSTKYERMQMLNALENVEASADIIIVDTGAGMNANVRDFLRAADEIIFVLTPDITSLADAYGLLKAICNEGLDKPVYSVINMVHTLRQSADTAQRFSGSTKHFLNCEVNNIGYLLKDQTVTAATSHRKPYTVFDPNARVSKNTQNIALTLLKQEDPEIKFSSAFSRYIKMLK